ncbi:endonuclease VIII [Acidaminobacter hydrogenoformans]|uniref:Formamidopyrimidine-DNA glycosylase n=1 Tax=Acidaminobacter hydrogenoformans DSM 2784 TaxID=1120920 RepID=A0A1G5S0Y6_9FIRM|nr:endonuclease VIII [Acidaminobacter hydrogenoformans]SCZ80032.1 formamidopyrimidine-DNA glycosylase [Acidaminobacter hydrogenoformans DSM 2784]
MLELPEAKIIARQLGETVCGREIITVVMNNAPHKFAFYSGDPIHYQSLLKGQRFETALAYGGMVELRSHDIRMVFSDGANLRLHDKGVQRPHKHQMLIEFSDGTALSGVVQMYGGLWCFKESTFENAYRKAALEKPSPLTSAFSKDYFQALIGLENVQKLSVKAFLATEQRVPGFGNGVLQDVLWSAHIHPKRKVHSLDLSEKDLLYHSIREVLGQMLSLGGRDTEKDLFGKNGGYYTHMSKLHAAEGCAMCGGTISKEAYLGGSIYYCLKCQKL